MDNALNLQGMIIMSLSIGLASGLCIFCIYRLFKAKK